VLLQHENLQAAGDESRQNALASRERDSLQHRLREGCPRQALVSRRQGIRFAVVTWQPTAITNPQPAGPISEL